MPPMEVKNETKKATTTGTKGLMSTPETGKCIIHFHLNRQRKTWIIGVLIQNALKLS